MPANSRRDLIQRLKG